jgi:hypothetical protein
MTMICSSKAYFTYHLMAVYGNAELRDDLSKKLKAQMQWEGDRPGNMGRSAEALAGLDEGSGGLAARGK